MAFFVRVSPRSGKGLNPEAPLLGMDAAEQTADKAESPIDESHARGNEQENAQKGEVTRSFARARGGVEKGRDVLEHASHVVEHTANCTADSFENIADHVITSFNQKIDLRGR